MIEVRVRFPQPEKKCGLVGLSKAVSREQNLAAVLVRTVYAFMIRHTPRLFLNCTWILLHQAAVRNNFSTVRWLSRWMAYCLQTKTTMQEWVLHCWEGQRDNLSWIYICKQITFVLKYSLLVMLSLDRTLHCPELFTPNKWILCLASLNHALLILNVFTNFYIFTARTSIW